MDTYTIQLEIKSATTKAIKKVIIEKGQVKIINYYRLKQVVVDNFEISSGDKPVRSEMSGIE